MSLLLEVTDPPVDQETLLQIVPIYIGGLLAWLLFGITLVQLYFYYVSYEGDPWYIKLTIYGIFVADIVQSVTVAAFGYSVLCHSWGRPTALLVPGWFAVVIPVISGLLAMWCQFFYAWRIYQLSRRKALVAAICTFSVIQTAAAWGIGFQVIGLHDLRLLHLTRLFVLTILWLGCGTVADVIIMISMVYFLLSKSRDRQLLPKSELMVNRLIALSIETGLSCALTALLELILFFIFQDNNLHFVFSFMLGKVYSNTLMVSLNSRRSSRVTTYSGKTSSSGFYSFTHPPALTPSSHPGIPMQTRVEITSERQIFPGPGYKGKSQDEKSVGAEEETMDAVTA